MALDRWDVICAAGLALLTVGLWRWFGPGVGLTALGGALLALGLAGARLSGSSRGDGAARPGGG